MTQNFKAWLKKSQNIKIQKQQWMKFRKRHKHGRINKKIVLLEIEEGVKKRKII